MDSADFERIFNALPAQYAGYDLDWTIVAMTDSLLASLGRAREDVVGRNQFEAFPDDPDDPDASGNATMLSAFERVLEEQTGHVLPTTRYDIADADGVFRERHWRPLNEPVFDGDGRIQYVIHGVEDVTSSVLAGEGDGYSRDPSTSSPATTHGTCAEVRPVAPITTAATSCLVSALRDRRDVVDVPAARTLGAMSSPAIAATTARTGTVPRPVPGVVTSDGVALHVEIRGRTGPLVVFCHGFTVDSDEWSRQVDALQHRARIVTWDQRGHGRSGWGDPAHATVDQLGRDLAAVLDAVAPRERVLLAGHSMGGMTIMALARQHPEWFGTRIAGVLLVATSAGEILHEGLVGLLHRGARRLGVLPAVLGGLRAAAPVAEVLPWRGSRAGRWFLRRMLFSRGDTGVDLREVQRVTESLPLPVGAAFSGAMLDLDESAALPTLRTVPTTVVVAEDDRLTPAAHGERIGNALGPSGRVVRVPDAAHAVPQTHPCPVDGALFDLLARLY